MDFLNTLIKKQTLQPPQTAVNKQTQKNKQKAKTKTKEKKNNKHYELSYRYKGWRGHLYPITTAVNSWWGIRFLIRNWLLLSITFEHVRKHTHTHTHTRTRACAHNTHTHSRIHQKKKSTRCNGYNAELQPRSKRVRTPVVLFRSLITLVKVWNPFIPKSIRQGTIAWVGGGRWSTGNCASNWNFTIIPNGICANQNPFWWRRCLKFSWILRCKQIT